MKAAPLAEPTPGPWRVVPSPPDLNANVYGPRRAHVAQVWSGHDATLAVALANAHLIAAAPALLNVARRIIGGYGMSADFLGGLDREVMRELRAAVASAEGGK